MIDPNTNPGYDIQTAVADYGTYYSLYSEANKREFPVLVFMPRAAEANPSKRWPVVYQLHGVNGQPITEDGLRALYHPQSGLQDAADQFGVIIVCTLTGNFFYLDAPLDPTIRIKTYVGEELVNFVDDNLPSVGDREHRILAGFSMGGGGAVRLLCQYPDTFSVALSRGGALDPGTGVTDLDWDEPNAFLNPLLGDFWGAERKHWHAASCLNTINHVRDRDDIAIVLEVGRDDFLYKCNQRLRRRLEELGVRHIYAEYPEGHSWGRNQLFSLYTHLQYFLPTTTMT